MNLDPLNFKILNSTGGMVTALQEITSTDMFDGPGSNVFHNDGLFSNRIFGVTGTEERDRNFGRIKVTAPILHPHIFELLKTTKSFYYGLLSGTEYGIWNPKTNDFDVSNQLEGETGYAFFMSHWLELNIDPKNSRIRKKRVAVINKYKKEAVVENILVLPAGMRDVEIGDNGDVTESELNVLYRKLISISRSFNDIYGEVSDVYDKTRLSLQRTFNEHYNNIKTLLIGKSGFIADKWASRGLEYGTRNVISAMDTKISSVYDVHNIDVNVTSCGAWQVAVGNLPLSIYKIKMLLDRIGVGDTENLYKTDFQTGDTEYITLDSKERDQWLTEEGIGKVITRTRNVDLRNKPILINNRFNLGYIKINGKSVKLLSNLDGLTDDEIKKCRAITYFDLIYISIADMAKEVACIITRYPITESGSVYPSRVRIRTQIETLNLIDEDTGVAYPEFPIYKDGNSFIESTMVHKSRLMGLDGDYDGDMVNVNFVFGKKTIAELNAYFNSVAAYINPTGGFKSPMATLTTDLVMNNITGGSK